MKNNIKIIPEIKPPICAAYTTPPPEEEDRQLNNKVTIHTTKIRNGRHMSFDVYMNWPCVKIDPTQSAVINEKPHAAAKFGTDKNEGSKDV